MLDRADPTLTPRLTLRVGVTGHRPNKLADAQQARIWSGAKAILECLSEAAESVRASHADVLSSEPVDLRLVTSLAEGADTILSEAGREAGYRLDVILPFAREIYARAQGFSAEAFAKFDGLLSVASRHSLLELDGNPDDVFSANNGYLAAGRRVVAHSDILIAVWNGEREDGVGGTAQILREALERGVPVLWMRPDGDACLLVEPSNLSSFADQASLLLPGGTCSPELANLVGELLAPPQTGTEAGSRLRRFLAEPHRTGSTWSQYDLLRRLLTGRKYKRRLDYSIDPATNEAWERYHQRSVAIGGDDFSKAIAEKLKPRWKRADNIALHCSHAYRSTYVLNFILAALAIVIGLISVFWWTAENSVTAKAICVFIEVSLIFLILHITQRGNRTHRDWHVRWLEARSIAELLRSARPLLLLGSTAAPQGQIDFRDDDSWVEWYVRATIREMGPPTGRLDAKTLKAAIASAIEDEVSGQLAYNAGAAATYHKFDHHLHEWGERLFKATLVVGLSYLAFAAVYLIVKSMHWEPIMSYAKYSKDPIKAVVTVLGAGLPAFGAALFGIRATGDYRLASEQAERTYTELQDISARLEKEARKDDPEREKVLNLLYSMSRCLVSDVRDWSRIYRARELQLPG